MDNKIVNIIISIIFTCLIQVTKSQSLSLMTNAEIYDFNIGDIFETKIGGYSTPPTYNVDTIINKYYNTSTDTVFYIVNSHSYTYPACPPPCTGSSSSYLGHIIYYTHLNDTVGKDLGTKPTDYTCIDTAGYTGSWVDTTYHDPNFCNTITTEIKFMNNGPILVDSCYTYFEPYYEHYIYGKGLGWISYYYNTCSNGAPNCESGKQLVYYKKGSNSCGTYSPIYVTGVSEMTITDEQITISPNPVNMVFNIKTNSEDQQIIDLYDINGKHLLNKIIYSTADIEVNNLESGMYTLSIKSKSGVINKKIIIAH